MTEFITAYSKKENKYMVSILSGESVYEAHLSPKELDKFIDCLLSIKEPE